MTSVDTNAATAPLVTLLRNALPGSDPDHVQQIEGLATGRNTIRPVPKGLPFRHRLGGNRHLLAMSPEPNTEVRNQCSEHFG